MSATAGTIVEADLRDFFRRLGHAGYGCSEWVLTDPRTREIRGCGFFNDIDFLLQAVADYADVYNVQVCRNPRPLALLTTSGASNQFNRGAQKPTPLEGLELLTQTVFCVRGKAKESPQSLAPIASGLLVRLGIAEYAVETAGNCLNLRIGFEPSAIRKFGSPDEARTLFARLEDHLREAMTPEEKNTFELLPWSGPDLFDPPVGIAQSVGHLMVPGAWIYAPPDQYDPALTQLLSDLAQGKTTRVPSKPTSTAMLARTEGLITEWDEVPPEDEAFIEGGGILPRGAKLKIESEEGKQVRNQLDNMEALAREVFLRRTRQQWALPWPSKTLTTRLAGGSRPGEMVLFESNSYRGLQDYLGTSVEALLRNTETLVFQASTRQSPGSYYARALERITSKSLEEIDGISGEELASQAFAQVKAQFKRPPIIFPLSLNDTLEQVLSQVRDFHDADPSFKDKPCLLVLDGFDDLVGTHPKAALRSLRHLAQESGMTIWLGVAGHLDVDDALLDHRAQLVLGELPLRSWIDTLPDCDADKKTTQQVLPQLFPESAQGRVATVLRLSQGSRGWTQHAYLLYHPQTGRYRNIAVPSAPRES